jgi:glycosyltransferase involved in cell wall biosynthesis
VFANQMQTLLDDPARAREIGCAVRERAIKLFSWERAGREIERVYARVSRATQS